MNNKKYVFIEEGEWIHCCSADGCYDNYMERYRCINHTLEDYMCSEEDIHIAAILDVFGLTHHQQNLYDLSLEELKAMCFEAGIELEIVV